MNTRNFPLFPLDRLFESLGDIAQDTFKCNGFPFHDVIKVDDTSFRLVFALAGYSEDEIDLQVEGDKLTVAATKVSSNSEVNYIHRGITKSAFSRIFVLPPYGVVSSAELKNGLLTIDIKVEIPDEQKPRKINIVSVKSTTESRDYHDEVSGE